MLIDQSLIPARTVSRGWHRRLLHGAGPVLALVIPCGERPKRRPPSCAADADCASHRKPRVAVNIGGSFSWHQGKSGEVEFRCRYPPIPRTLVGSGPCTPGHRVLPVLHAHRRFAWTNDGWLLQIFWNPLNAVPHHRDSSSAGVELANEALLVLQRSTVRPHQSQPHGNPST